MVLVLPLTKQPGKSDAFVEFLTDSPEQIAESTDRAGLRDKLDQAFAAAITRARGCPQRSFGPAINEAREVDSGNDASLK